MNITGNSELGHYLYPAQNKCTLLDILSTLIFKTRAFFLPYSAPEETSKHLRTAVSVTGIHISSSSVSRRSRVRVSTSRWPNRPPISGELNGMLKARVRAYLKSLLTQK